MRVEESVLAQYELVIGLEIHAQLMTESKIFAPDATTFGAPPNTNISLVTLAHPGTLPRLNEKVAELAIRMGLALQCEISRYNVFDRKNYFYPDLPKGYQITQEKTPICLGGGLRIRPEGESETFVRLNRIHLEEDAGKLVHPAGKPYSQVDLNRAGVPLIEIVTEPDLRTPEQAAAYLTEIRRLVRYLGVCDGNMEEGSLRCDANVSVRRKGDPLGQKVEVKNLNSIRNVARAIAYENIRQIYALENGEVIRSETRLFNVQTSTTTAMRTKETLTDYRYFPDPDLPPFVVSDAFLGHIRTNMPALPWEVQETLQTTYGLPEYDAAVLSDERETADYFLQVAAHTKAYKAISNWLMGPAKAWCNEQRKNMSNFPLSPPTMAELIELVEDNKVSFAAASQKLLPALLGNPVATPAQTAKDLGILQESDEAFLLPLIEEIIQQYPEKVKEYKKGKKGLIGFFMGELMKRSKGKADPKKSNDVVRRLLEQANV